MAGPLDIPEYHAPDLVGPVAAALSLYDRRQNAKTQRMFAENQMRRESAEEARRAHDDQVKEEERKRTHAIEQANTLAHLGQTMNQFGAGPAQAIASAYGIDLHPAAAATMAANAPTVDQQIDREIAGSRETAPPVTEGPQQQESPVEGPAESPALEEQRWNAPQANPLEALMSAAAPEKPATPAMPAMPPQYEATIGANKYPIAAPAKGSGLGEKWDAIYDDLIAHNWTPEKAREFVAKEKSTADAEAGRETRMMDLLGARNAETEKMRGQYSLTAEQKMAEAEKNRVNSRQIAAMRAAAQGAATTPSQQNGLAELIGMAENGASKEDVARRAAELHINPKVWESPIHQVTSEATAGNRAGEARAGLEATDDTGKPIGTWKDKSAAKIGNENLTNFHRVKERLEALKSHIAKYGNRVDLLSKDQIQERTSIGESVVAALRPWNKLSNTAAGQQMEANIVGSLGSPGHGWLWGANPGIIDHLLTEAEGQNRAQLNVYLRSPDSHQLPAAIGGPKPKTKPANGEPDFDAIEAWANGLGKK